MTEDSATSKRGGRSLAIVMVVVLLLGLAGWRGWTAWQARAGQAQAKALADEQRAVALEQRLEALRRDQRTQAQRIQDAAATNRVLRDEVLGLSQRGALLEDSVSRLADPTRHGAQALRLDEVELLLIQAQRRLEIANDLDGARRAYALAAGALQRVDDPRLLNLRQALAQERSALDALGSGPQAAVSAGLDRLAASLAALPRRSSGPGNAERPAWQRALAPLVEVRPTAGLVAVAPSDRAAGEAAIQLELTLARAALERDDAAALHGALDRIGAWLPRLWPESASLQQAQNELRSLRAAPLQPELPVLGSTLLQLRQLRDRGISSIALPAPVSLPRASTGVEP